MQEKPQEKKQKTEEIPAKKKKEKTKQESSTIKNQGKANEIYGMEDIVNRQDPAKAERR
jgi:hypothetical protein